MIPIGGAEDRSPDSVILREMVHRAGGAEARIVIVPTASEDPEQRGKEYEECFRAFEPAAVDVLDIRARPDCGRPEFLSLLADASLVFFGGGDQLRLSSLLGGTQFHEALIHAYNAGVVVAGTSAGAAVLPATMIFQTNRFRVYRKGGLEMTMGLGLIHNVLFDTHFVNRSRISRLIHSVATNPSLLGLGLEENTALIVENEERALAIGAGTVIVIDARGASINSIGTVENGKPFAITHLDYSVLTHGVSLDLHLRKFEAAAAGDVSF